MEPFPELPFAPGQSPFHVKGVVLAGLLEYVESTVPGGIEAVRERLEDPQIRAFSEQSFLAVGWYDFLPVLHVLGAAALASRSGTREFITAYSTWQARRDVQGIYRLLLKLSSPEALGRRLPTAFARYFDFARIETLSITKGVSEVMVRGLPSLLLEWYRTSVDAAAATMLEMAGARRVETAYSAPEEDGAQAGVPKIRFRVRRTWTS